MCTTKFPTNKNTLSLLQLLKKKKQNPWYNFVFILLFCKTRNVFIYNVFFNLTSISEQLSLKKQQIKALKIRSPKYVCWCMRVCTHALCPWISYNLVIVLAVWESEKLHVDLSRCQVFIFYLWDAFRARHSLCALWDSLPMCAVCCLHSPTPDILVHPPISVWFSVWWVYPQRWLSQSPSLA